MRNPWCDPADGQNDTGLRVVAQAGAFRGFGGSVHRAAGGRGNRRTFPVRSGDDCWLLTADVFGATFHRAAPSEFEAAKREQPFASGS